MNAKTRPTTESVARMTAKVRRYSANAIGFNAWMTALSVSRPREDARAPRSNVRWLRPSVRSRRRDSSETRHRMSERDLSAVYREYLRCLNERR